MPSDQCEERGWKNCNMMASNISFERGHERFLNVLTFEPMAI